MDPVTGLPYRLQDTMPEAVLTQCRHWVNYPQVLLSQAQGQAWVRVKVKH